MYIITNRRRGRLPSRLQECLKRNGVNKIPPRVIKRLPVEHYIMHTTRQIIVIVVRQWKVVSVYNIYFIIHAGEWRTTTIYGRVKEYEILNT